MTVKNVEKLEKSRVAVTVEVGAEEFEAAVAKAYAKARGKLSIPGFRPGKAPRKMIEKLYGAGVFYSDAVDIALPEAYTQAIGQSGLDVVGYPEIEIVDDKIDENGFTFKATVAVYPEVKLGEYKGLTAEKEEIKVSADDVKERLNEMAERNARLVSVDRKAKKGDIAVIHLGINDTDPRNWPFYRDEFVSDYLALIDTLRQQNPKCRVLIALLSPITHNHPRFESGTQQWHEEIQEAIKTVARVGKAQLIDFHKPLYAYPQLLPDAVHPNKEGATMLARTVCAAILGNYGGLQMPMTYSDNMVLQRDRELTIHGTANSGERVTVSITRPDAAKGKSANGAKHKKGKQPMRVRALKTEVQTATAKADMNGYWQVTLRPQRAENGLTLTVSTDEKELIYNNVAFGEVWLCSGQSNMEMPLRGFWNCPIAGANETIATSSKWKGIRVATVEKNGQLQPVDECKGSWKVSNPENAPAFSATALRRISTSSSLE